MLGRIFLGRYETQKLLGEGGMGKVYLAKQIDLGRSVVVKVMHDHVAHDTKFRDRFQRETLLMARFQHPNAVTLYDASLTDQFGPCIVMEYVKGENLETLLKKNGRMTPGRVARVLTQLCDVLQAAHEEGIIHRDLKPANIMIVDPDTPKERVKVMDFGLAKLVEDGRDRRVTDTTIDFAVGTPGYICPEQVRGEAMDHRGDLYSVGVLIFELLAGRLPFLGANSMDVLLAHATEDPPTFAELGLTGIPKPVEECIHWIMAKEPADRPQSARELAERFVVALGTHRSRKTPPAMDAVPTATSAGSESEPIMLIATVAASPAAAPDQVEKPPKVPTTLNFQMEAYMPESIAVMKLRGFAHDTAGQILESLPGLVKMRIKGMVNESAGLSWLGITRKVDGPIDLELHLKQRDNAPNGNLNIEVLFRPSHACLLADESWQKRCSRLFIQLRGYLIG